MSDVGRQIWEIRVPRDVELTPLENRNEQEKNKDNEKRNQEKWKNEKNERWMKEHWKMIFHEMILSLITLKHSLDLLILSFGTLNPVLHYVLKSPFWLNMDIWTKEFLPWENFHKQQDCCLYSSAKVILINHSPVRDKFWIVKCIIG